MGIQVQPCCCGGKVVFVEGNPTNYMSKQVKFPPFGGQSAGGYTPTGDRQWLERQSQAFFFMSRGVDGKRKRFHVITGTPPLQNNSGMTPQLPSKTYCSYNWDGFDVQTYGFQPSERYIADICVCPVDEVMGLLEYVPNGSFGAGENYVFSSGSLLAPGWTFKANINAGEHEQERTRPRTNLTYSVADQLFYFLFQRNRTHTPPIQVEWGIMSIDTNGNTNVVHSATDPNGFASPWPARERYDAVCLAYNNQNGRLYWGRSYNGGYGVGPDDTSGVIYSSFPDGTGLQTVKTQPRLLYGNSGPPFFTDLYMFYSYRWIQIDHARQRLITNLWPSGSAPGSIYSPFRTMCGHFSYDMNGLDEKKLFSYQQLYEGSAGNGFLLADGYVAVDKWLQ